MIRGILAAACALAFFGLTGCSADCEVCVEFMGEKECGIVKDVKKSDCRDCSDVEGAAEAKAAGLEVTCTVK